MTLDITRFVLAALLTASSVFAQQQPPQPAPLQPGQTADPFPQPIEARQGVITVGVREFASVPDIEVGHAPFVLQRHARSALQREL